MKKTTLFLLIVFAGSLFLTSCKKYDNGPDFSFIPAKNRVENTWKIDSWYVNGASQSTSFFSNSTYIYTKEGVYTEKWTSGGLSLQTDGTWKFSSDKEKISITINNATKEYTILKLYNDSFWLSISENNQTTEIHYIPA
ncbi:MAG: hypothetical protein V2A54_06370 [Bacteroidota bacterium]